MTLGATPAFIVTRVLLVVEDGASVTLVESHEGAGVAHQANTAVEISVGDEAKVEHVSAERLRAGGHRSARRSAWNSARSLELHVRGVSRPRPSLSRNQIFLRYTGEHSSVTIAGGALLKGRQHADTTLVVDHAVPHCDSRELFKNVLDGESTGVFQGKIVVQPVAQKTDGRMMSQAVLLADGATMNNKPELEIFADDVQCAHGATCGALDDDLLFYLRARGLPKPEAEALMLQAFVGEALELVENETVRAVDGRRSGRLAEGESLNEAKSMSASPRTGTAPARRPFDLAAIRADFPILSTQVYGKPLVYLDNAASAQKPRQVIERDGPRLRARIRKRPSRAALSRERRDGSL